MITFPWYAYMVLPIQIVVIILSAVIVVKVKKEKILFTRPASRLAVVTFMVLVMMQEVVYFQANILWYAAENAWTISQATKGSSEYFTLNLSESYHIFAGILRPIALLIYQITFLKIKERRGSTS